MTGEAGFAGRKSNVHGQGMHIAVARVAATCSLARGGLKPLVPVVCPAAFRGGAAG